MVKIREVKSSDKDFWYTLDGHLPLKEFKHKVRDKMGYVILDKDQPVGIMRYNLFWDNTPFLNLIYFDEVNRNKGYGTKAIKFWEEEMKKQGFHMLMTSTQVDEMAQHFYRKMGYKDCGCLVVEIPQFAQPMEMFMIKEI